MTRVFLSCAMMLLFLLIAPHIYAITSEEIDQLLTPSPVEKRGTMIKNDEYTIELIPESTSLVQQEPNEDSFLTSSQQKQFDSLGAVEYQTLDYRNVFRSSTDSIRFDISAGKQVLDSSLSIEMRHPHAGFVRMIARTTGPLSTESGHIIDSTTCDDELRPCTPDHEAEWIQDTSYGWGVSMLPLDYSSQSLKYQPLNDKFITQLGSPVYFNSIYHAVVNLKIVTPPDNPESTYRTSILFYLLPY